MKIGFTGTQKGMSERQKFALALFCRLDGILEFHHGDCIGSDAEAHDIVLNSLGWYRVTIILHPPLNPSKRAGKLGQGYRTPLDYLERNKMIVNETDLLIAAPQSNEEEVRSGTWSTIRYARKLGRAVIILDR